MQTADVNTTQLFAKAITPNSPNLPQITKAFQVALTSVVRLSIFLCPFLPSMTNNKRLTNGYLIHSGTY